MPVLLTDWLDEVLEQAGGCTTSVATRALKLAGREFFRDSLAWQQWLGPVDVAPNTYVDFNTSAPTGSKIALCLFGKFKADNGEEYPLPPISWERIPKDTADSPQAFVTDGPNLVQVVPDVLTAKTAVLSIRAAFFPVDETTNLPDYAYDRFHETILAGALFRLYSSNDKPYTNATLAGMTYKLFKQGIGRFRDEAMRRYSRGDRLISFPGGWNAPSLHQGLSI